MADLFDNRGDAWEGPERPATPRAKKKPPSLSQRSGVYWTHPDDLPKLPPKPGFDPVTADVMKSLKINAHNGQTDCLLWTLSVGLAKLDERATKAVAMTMLAELERICPYGS